MEKNVQYLTKEHLDKYWEDIKPLLEKGLLASQHEINIEQVRLLIVQGAFHTVIGLDKETYEIVGCLVFEIINFPNYRVANIVSIGGNKMLVSEDDFVQFTYGLKKLGVSKIQGMCTPVLARLWKRKLKATIPYHIVRLDL